MKSSQLPTKHSFSTEVIRSQPRLKGCKKFSCASYYKKLCLPIIKNLSSLKSIKNATFQTDKLFRGTTQVTFHTKSLLKKFK